MKALYVNLEAKPSHLLEQIQAVTGTSQKASVIEALLCYAQYLEIIKDRRDYFINEKYLEVADEK